MKITAKQLPVDYSSASAYELACDFKFQGMDKYRAWSEFVKVRNLKPEINASEFYSIYEDAEPLPLQQVVEIDFKPTHYDRLRKMNCQISLDENGVYHLVWKDGSMGTQPPGHPPSPSRFEPLED